MDDYAMGLFLAAKRDIESKSSYSAKYLCYALRDVLQTEGMAHRSVDPLEIFPQFAATYDGKHFNRGEVVIDNLPHSIRNTWWYPAEDSVPRIAMIDFLVGK
mgnify:FL=1